MVLQRLMWVPLSSMPLFVLFLLFDNCSLVSAQISSARGLPTNSVLYPGPIFSPQTGQASAFENYNLLSYFPQPSYGGHGTQPPFQSVEPPAFVTEKPETSKLPRFKQSTSFVQAHTEEERPQIIQKRLFLKQLQRDLAKKTHLEEQQNGRSFIANNPNRKTTPAYKSVSKTTARKSDKSSSPIASSSSLSSLSSSSLPSPSPSPSPGNYGRLITNSPVNRRRQSKRRYSLPFLFSGRKRKTSAKRSRSRATFDKFRSDVKSKSSRNRAMAKKNDKRYRVNNEPERHKNAGLLQNLSISKNEDGNTASAARSNKNLDPLVYSLNALRDIFLPTAAKGRQASPPDNNSHTLPYGQSVTTLLGQNRPLSFYPMPRVYDRSNKYLPGAPDPQTVRPKLSTSHAIDCVETDNMKASTVSSRTSARKSATLPAVPVQTTPLPAPRPPLATPKDVRTIPSLTEQDGRISELSSVTKHNPDFQRDETPTSAVGRTVHSSYNFRAKSVNPQLKSYSQLKYKIREVKSKAERRRQQSNPVTGWDDVEYYDRHTKRRGGDTNQNLIRAPSSPETEWIELKHIIADPADLVSTDKNKRMEKQRDTKHTPEASVTQKLTVQERQPSPVITTPAAPEHESPSTKKHRQKLSLLEQWKRLNWRKQKLQLTPTRTTARPTSVRTLSGPFGPAGSKTLSAERPANVPKQTGKRSETSNNSNRRGVPGTGYRYRLQLFTFPPEYDPATGKFEDGSEWGQVETQAAEKSSGKESKKRGVYRPVKTARGYKYKFFMPIDREKYENLP